MDFKLSPVALLIPLVIVALLVGAGYYFGDKAGTVSAQPRIDSLTTILSNCQAVVAEAKTGGKVAEGFLQDYDKRIAELEDEKRVLQNAYSDTIAVLRRYNDREAERAIAAYYYRRQQ